MNRSSSPVRVACYVRCSTSQQAERDESTIETQIAETQRFAREQLACPDPAIYVDEGRTGTSLARPAWERLLADARARRVRAVVATYRTRIGRGEAATVAEYLLREAGCQVHYIHESFGEGRDGFVRRAVDTLTSGLYVEAIREATTSAMEEMVRRGHWIGGAAPLGYRAVPVVAGVPVPKRLVIEPEEAAIVRLTAAAFLQEGRLVDAQRAIRQHLPGQRWSLDAVRRLLSRRLYLGEMSLGKAINPSAHEAILDSALFAHIQERLSRRVNQEEGIRSAGYRSQGEAVFPLRGLVRCGSCGCLLTPATATTTRKGHLVRVGYYECSAFRKAGATHPCAVHRVNAEHLLFAVLSEVQRCAQHPTRLQAILSATMRGLKLTEQGTEIGVRLKTVRKLLREKADRVGRLRRMLETADMPGGAAAEILARVGELVREREVLEAEERSLLQQRLTTLPPAPEVAALWGQVTDLWPYVAPQERRSLVGALVQEIVMQGPRVGSVRLRVDSVRLPEKPIEGCSTFGETSLDRFAYSAEVGAALSSFENEMPPSSATFIVDWSKGPWPKFP